MVISETVKCSKSQSAIPRAATKAITVKSLENMRRVGHLEITREDSWMRSSGLCKLSFICSSIQALCQDSDIVNEISVNLLLFVA